MDRFTSAEHRAATIAGLRELADTLDAHDDLPLPTLSVDWYLFVYADSPREKDEEVLARQRTEAARLVRILGSADKYVTGNLFRYRHWFGGPDGLESEVIVDRPAVCERVVTGTREVTRLVPRGEDPRPVDVFTEEVEDVEWRCTSLLGGADDTAPGPVGAHSLLVDGS